MNYSPLEAVVKLGAKVRSVGSGKRTTLKAAPQNNGMFRMLLGYTGSSGEPVACYDRYIQHSPDSRDFLLLFPDPKQNGFSVFSFAEFGPFD